MNLDTIDALYKKIIRGNTDDFDGSQNRQEFLGCLCYLDQRIARIRDQEISFLEIGAFKGLWAIALKVLCEKNGKTPLYTTVTWLSHNPENQSLLRVKDFFNLEKAYFKLLDGNSADKDVIEAAAGSTYHFVLIDADHSYKGVRKDIANYGPLARELLLFHDINTRKCGVRKAINKTRTKLNLEISYGDIMGIGICDLGSPSELCSPGSG